MCKAVLPKFDSLTYQNFCDFAWNSSDVLPVKEPPDLLQISLEDSLTFSERKKYPTLTQALSSSGVGNFSQEQEETIFGVTGIMT